MTTLARGLIRIARALGRWILRRLILRGVDLVLGYIDGKIEDFKRRRRRARSDRRRRWLAGRVRRWRAAFRWLAGQRRRITRRLVETVDRGVSQLAEVANDERYGSWLRRQRPSRKAKPRRGRRAA